MYQVLYRKWRPRTFSDVCGQPHITKALQNEVRSGQLAHAYLFVGSRGTGKTSCAKILAKAVNCLNTKDGDPCNTCDVCRGIDDGSVLDVMEIDAASNNGVDSIRDLREAVHFTPAVAAYRVYIIDEVHMLSAGAFNALLKTLEEPPSHVIFILATTEVHKLPATILSRCQRFDFARISPEDIASRLHTVAAGEDFTLTDDAAILIARLSDGAMRDALSLTDQCLSRSREITVQVVSDAAGLAGREHLYTLSAAVRRADSAALLTEIDRLYRTSQDMGRLCGEWLEFYRELMLCKSVSHPEKMIAATDEEIARLQEEASHYPLSSVLHAMETLQEASAKLALGGDKRLQTELAGLRLCAPELDTSQEALLRRMDALERAVRLLQSETAHDDAETVPLPLESNQEEPNRSDVPPAPPNVPSASSPLGDEEKPFTQWKDVLALLQKTAPPLHAVLVHSSATVTDTHVIIDTDHPLFRSLAESEVNRNALTTAIAEITGKRYRIGVRNAPIQKESGEKPAHALSSLLQKARENGVPVSEE